MAKKLVAFADNAVVASGPGYHSPYFSASEFTRLNMLLTVGGGSITAEFASLLDDGVTTIPTPPSAALSSGATYSVGEGTSNPVGFGGRVKVILVLSSGTPVVKYEVWGE